MLMADERAERRMAAVAAGLGVTGGMSQTHRLERRCHGDAGVEAAAHPPAVKRVVRHTVRALGYEVQARRD